MQCKEPIVRDTSIKQGKDLTKREKRLGKVISPQINYTKKEWKAKKRKESEQRGKK